MITALLLCAAVFSEASRITGAPDPQMVPFDDTVNFTCSGVGSFIRINWIFNQSLPCNAASCDSDFLSFHQTLHANISNNLTIDSTLEINSSRLEQSPEVFPIECRVEQMMPSELNLPGQMANFHTDLRVTVPAMTDPNSMNDPMTDPATDPMTTNPATGSVTFGEFDSCRIC